MLKNTLANYSSDAHLTFNGVCSPRSVIAKIVSTRWIIRPMTMIQK